MSKEGTLIKAYGGFYYVLSGGPPASRAERGGQGQIVECQLRGKLKKLKEPPIAGDRVKFSLLEDAKPACSDESYDRTGRGIIEDFFPRISKLSRPKVVNVNQAVLVFSVKNPALETEALDRFLVLSEQAGLRSAICINKKDLVESPAGFPLPGSIWAELNEAYAKAGYPLVYASAAKQEGIAELITLMRGKISVLAGPSGTGKTSLLNAIQPGLNLKVGELTDRGKRGKHTTRHVELLALGEEKNILVADAPGFTHTELKGIKPRELARYFPEIYKYAPECDLSLCVHLTEPRCAVKEALKKGLISKSRYESYIKFYREIGGK